jgi:MFS family permease
VATGAGAGVTREDSRFLGSFLVLSVVSGLTVGLGKIVTTLYAISLDATPFQVGVISAMESVGMVLVTVPAGFLIARYGARWVYFLSSLGPMLVNLAMPFLASWIALALGRWSIGLCIPFRIVSMNGSFLERVPRFGASKAGWYRASLTGGMAIVGPVVATLLTTRASIETIFFVVAGLFGLMALFSLSFLPARERRQGSAEANFFGELRLLLGHPRVAESCLVEFTSSATNALFGTFILLLAATIPGLSEQDGIRVMLFQGCAMVALLFLGGSLFARMSISGGYAFSVAAASLALVTFASATSLGMLAVGAVLLALGSSAVHLINVKMLVELPGGKSKVAGVYNLASMTGSSFGALAGGAASKLVPLNEVFLLWLPLLLAAGLAVQILHHRRSAPAVLARGDA